MPRRPKFTEDEILDAALALVADAGPDAATIAAISRRAGAPSGSIYHRFRSRELLLARLWTRTVRRFQLGFLRAFDADSLDGAATDAALHVVRWSREHPDQARVLVLYRREDLAARWPQELGDELAAVNADVDQALRGHARRRYGRDDAQALQRVALALVDIPYAAARRHLLAGNAPPPTLDPLVVAAAHAVLGYAR